MNNPAKLALADGTIYTGYSFGAEGETFGEVVFNTSMTGYQEILTDPSYFGQIVTMTYPQIGNYGANSEDLESKGVSARGFIVRENCDFPSNYRSNESLSAFLKKHGIIAIEGLDTRALVKRLRVHGVMTGVLSTIDLDDESLRQKAQGSPELAGHDYAKEVMTPENLDWSDGLTDLGRSLDLKTDSFESAPHIVALDYGMKWNIPRHLTELGCKVTVMPGNSSAQDILAAKPDGVFLSNGPGDPRPLEYAVGTIQELLGEVPIFGICLGHQLLGLACGMEIFKLKFGHRGANQPVKNHLTQQVEITSQNHGFALDADSVPADVEITHTNLNDNTVAGIRHKTHPAFSVQYHPESSAGPHDSRYLFQQFREMLSPAKV
ncbi:glutamine-hydrolyzing carbamoyl-phosphate synthase small subunit [Calycomorphotria hydatis]|uniref:Carbamoyl phosphate synthase small chain n=1 Tax=Calycomorphotria hydatis TaxID=2528027 RepID=A0A517TCW6_9PLAN|nr:glutamine-hydrolyzing carbamoyl-phosphate synthase small subunit [Calycomorphotria hydatis]QDT66220.1 Carbamoyl-phosphate synthase small chain [Calycomorphotria hydatis]